MTKRRLSEQDLAQLYLQTQAPLRLDDLLQGQPDAAPAQIAVHDSIAGQTPDLALISLSLCGLIIARDYPTPLKDGPLGPVLRELAVCAENNLLTIGRMWLDTAIYGIAPDLREDRPVIETIPDRLRILTSIFMELRDAVQGEAAASGVMTDALRTLYYQAESHADLAERFILTLARKPKKPAAKEQAAKQRPERRVPDQIPLPFELTRPREGAEIVSFSLFQRPR